jgi:hypothetical protein
MDKSQGLQDHNNNTNIIRKAFLFNIFNFIKAYAL